MISPLNLQTPVKTSETKFRSGTELAVGGSLRELFDKDRAEL